MKRLKFNPILYISTIFHNNIKKFSKRKSEVNNNEDELSLFWHIQELRKHCIYSIIWLAFFSSISFVFMNPIINFLEKPYNNSIKLYKNNLLTQNLSSISIFEVITVNFKICFLIGLSISLPFILRELWKFIVPALYENEKKIAQVFIVASVILFYTGIAFGFYLVIPYFFSNALTWSSQYAHVMITYENYFNSLIILIFIFGIVFEIPVILSLLGMAGLISSDLLKKNRKITFILCFIIGAILSPPEVLSLCLIALPMYFMTEISIYFIKKIEEKRMLIEISKS